MIPRELIEHSRPIADVARENGNWVKTYRAEHREEEPPLTLDERAKLKQLEKENRELRAENNFLGKASVFFAKKYP